MSSIIIFGGSRGIGKIIAEHFITEGHDVSVASRDLKALDKFQKSIIRKKLNTNVVRADITYERDVDEVFESHKAKWHNTPDAVINCAAVQGPIGSSWSIPVKKWDEAVNVNLIGAYIVARAAIRQMVKNRRGSIIMFSGGGAAYGRPNFCAYGVSKTGVLRMVETMAEELKSAGYSQIIINAIAPGAVKTRMTGEVIRAGSKAGQKALEEAAEMYKTGGTPAKQITDLIDFLIDPNASYGLTGRLIHVREDYRGLIKAFESDVPEEMGKIRRIPIKITR